MNDVPKDVIGDAIAAAEKDVDMFSIPVVIASTGRPCQISVPADASEAEILEIVGWMATSLAAATRAHREKGRSGLVIARSVNVKGGLD